MTQPYYLMELPTTEYREALELQHKLVAARRDGILDRDIVLLLEHPPVFTLGRRGGREHLIVAEGFIRSKGMEVVHAERGGDVTYHGPGQLVCYPIVDLRARQGDVLEFVGALEEVMIRTVADWGITAVRNTMNRGVWVGRDKLGSVGIAIRKGISFHGFALNVNTVLEPFTWIHPCGLEGVLITSMKRVLEREVPMEDIRRAVLLHMGDIFRLEWERITPETIYRLMADHVRERAVK